jgi:putative ABC transport system ATP-binding protein
VLEARGLVKNYRAPGGTPIRVLDQVDLVVPAGRLAVVLGPSGCGKSTLLNVLGLLEDADGGDVLWRGERVSALGRTARSRARARTVGFVFQSFLLLPSLTALDNVLLAGRYAGRTGPDTRQRARELLARFGVLERQDHFPPQLSGGEQQRVAFCRAVLNDPPLLLADEPTGNLDSSNTRDVLRLLRRAHDQGQAILMVTHDARVASLADRVINLFDGMVADDAKIVPIRSTMNGVGDVLELRG